MIIGLSGYATCGKDSLADAMYGDGWERISFADKVKEMAYRLGWDGKKDAKGRLLLVRLGHGMREVVGEDVWVNALLPPRHGAALRGWMANQPDLVVTDCRYQNEARRIKAYGGSIVRVNRPGVGPACDEDGNPYQSEIELDDWNFDHIVYNDGNLLDLIGIARALNHRL